jgi:hypothetical protein
MATAAKPMVVIAISSVVNPREAIGIVGPTPVAACNGHPKWHRVTIDREALRKIPRLSPCVAQALE